ncbi:MAG TPA: hypothetical protein VNQ73_10855 [Ilumatobacter sp.]|nr:hypothetical protein [Ilumatobacter sp.]
MGARRIDTVVRIRELQERLARAEVARCQAAARAAADHERDSWTRLAERDQALRSRFPAGGLSYRSATLAGGVTTALRAGVRTASATLATSEALGRWTIAARDHDGVERLAERLATEAREHEQRRDAANLDELVVQRHAAVKGPRR